MVSFLMLIKSSPANSSCCLVHTIMKSVLLSFSFNRFVFIHSLMSVIQFWREVKQVSLLTGLDVWKLR